MRARRFAFASTLLIVAATLPTLAQEDRVGNLTPPESPVIPSSTAPDALFEQSMSFLQTFILPSIGVERSLYDELGLPVPEELAEVEHLGGSAHTWDDLAAVDAAIRRYAERVSADAHLTAEQSRTVTERITPLLTALEERGLETADLEQHLSSLTTMSEVQGLLAAVSERGLQAGPEATERSPAIDLSPVGSPDEVLSAALTLATALRTAGAETDAMAAVIRDGGTEELPHILPELVALTRLHTLPSLASDEEALNAVGAYLRRLAESATILFEANADAVQRIADLTEELNRVRGADLPATTFLARVRATLPLILGDDDGDPQQAATRIAGELRTTLTELRSLASTIESDADRGARIAQALSTIEDALPVRATPTSLAETFRLTPHAFAELQAALPSPSLRAVREDLRSVLSSIQEYLHAVKEDGATTAVPSERLGEMQSALDQVLTEADLDGWFASFDALFPTLHRAR